jgi:hypothetical protein
LGRVVAVESKKEDKQQADNVANQQVLSPLHERSLALGHDVCDEIGEYRVFFVNDKCGAALNQGWIWMV